MPHNIGNFEARSDGPPAKQTIPDFEFDAAKWRAACNENAKIPAGYTYLSQLMGHDLGKTLPASQVPWTAQHTGETMPNARYNLIENPLTLETIYGKGPAGTQGLFNRRNCLFRLDKEATQALRVRYWNDEVAEPLLADMRNRDTLMLHKMAVLWMQYHNEIAREIMAEDGFDERSHVAYAYFFGVFTRARQVVLAAWHRVLLQDMLPAMAHPKALALSDAALEKVYLLEDIPLLNGIMRSFHALPLARYRLSAEGDFPFSQLRAGKTGELRNWRIDWRYFFGENAANKTGFSASYSSLFTVFSGRSIMDADLKSAINVLPYDSLHEEVIAAHERMPDALKQDISATELERLFNVRAAAAGVTPVPKGGFAKIPLFLMLMLEAQFYGENGGLGPFGSCLLRRFLSHKISSINAGGGVAGFDPAHATISEIINYVENA